MIKVVVVEDSPVVREFLLHILGSDPDIEIVGVAHNGEEALEAIMQRKPDVVTMDIHMPKMNGLEATRRIMETQPTPIVIVSGSSTTDELTTTFHALEAGALAVVHRPTAIGHPEYEVTAQELVRTVKLMSEVKVVRRWRRHARKPGLLPTPMQEVRADGRGIKVIAIGASTGGPVVLQTILTLLSKQFPVPILIVQHMSAGFHQGFVEWLSQSSGFPVHVAANSELLLPAHVYVAPDGFHMGVDRLGRIALCKDEPENGLRPSVSYLFRSVAETYGQYAIGVLLTGMGKDGASELKLMKQKGAVTIVQDRETSIVFGMPGEAVQLDAAMYVLPVDKIAEALMTLVDRRE